MNEEAKAEKILLQILSRKLENIESLNQLLDFFKINNTEDREKFKCCWRIKKKCDEYNIDSETKSRLIRAFYNGTKKEEDINKLLENIKSVGELEVVLKSERYETIPETIKNMIIHDSKVRRIAIKNIYEICDSLCNLAKLQILKKIPASERIQQLIYCYKNPGKCYTERPENGK